MPPVTSRTLARLRSMRGNGAPDEAAPATGRRPYREVAPITRELELRTAPERVWAALTDPGTIKAWLTCQNVTFEARPGGRYSLFDGDATGTVTRAERPRVLEYTWTMAGWPMGSPPSQVRWELQPASSGKRTRVRLTHSALPDEETRAAHDAGWDPNFLDKLRGWIER
jgi:uncharacterized protein YndB with AHSA1/START domain